MRTTYLIFLFIFTLSTLSASSSLDLNYSIKPIFSSENSLELEVNLQFLGNSTGITEIVLPKAWIDHLESYQEITHLTSSTNREIEDTDQIEVKRIRHAANELIDISYHVVKGNWGKEGWYFCPIVEKEYFHCFGDFLFVIPKIEEEAPLHVSLAWKDFPSEWSIANSFGVQERIQSFDCSTRYLMPAVFIGGDYKITQGKNEKSSLFVAARQEWISSIEEFSDVAQKIIEIENSFWDDFTTPQYLITISPLGPVCDSLGRSLTNSFSLLLSDRAFTPDPNSWKGIIQILSHEYFHNWNGLKINYHKDAEEVLWFSEGFTDFYTLSLPFRAKLLSPDEYIESWNSILYDYYTSPSRNISNEILKENVFIDTDIGKLPYLRGSLFAAYWNEKIQQSTGECQSLDDLMLAIWETVKKEGCQISPSDIEEHARTFLGDQAKLDLQKYILQGDTIPLRCEMFGLGYALQWVEDPGFNISRATSSKTLIGVRENSKAYLAGLRSGQSLLQYQIHGNEVSVLISNEQEITFTLDSSPLLVPQLTKK